MDTNLWLWIALIAFLIFCCIPMLFMGSRRGHPKDTAKGKERDSDN